MTIRILAQFTVHYTWTKTRLTLKAIATNGRPPFVTRLKIFGAWPRIERPYKTREEEYRKLLPDEKALVKIAALMMCGRTRIPARSMAMTYGLRGRKVRSDARQRRPVRNSPLSGVTSLVQ